LGVTAGGTFVVAKYRVFPYAYLNRMEAPLRPILKNVIQSPDQGLMPSSGLIPSNLFGLNYRSILVPVTRAGAGGGLTSINEELVLLTHEGGIWLVDPEGASRTNIVVPPNGFDEYVETAREFGDSFRHNFNYFRYNDLLYLSGNERPRLVISFTEWLDDIECYVTAVAQLDLPKTLGSVMDVSANAADWRVFFRTHPCMPLKPRFRAIEGHMAGGRLTDYGNSQILLASGDYSWDGFYAPQIVAQDNDTDYGKILHINVETGTVRTVSKGHRNPQGIVVSSDGTLWSTEHGPRGGDELNRIIEGGNYGWPLETYGTAYNKSPHPTAADYGRHSNFIPPTFAWVPSVGASNLTTVEGFHPAWDGDLLVASLAGRSLFRVRLRENRAVFAEPILIGKRIRYVHQHDSETIVLWTDDHMLMFLSVVEHDPSSIVENILELESDLTEDERAAVEAAIDDCMVCHSFDSTNHINAPGLGAIFAARPGSTAFQGYSDAMKRASGSWSEQRLLRFLEDPQAVVPGTTMPSPSIEDERTRRAVVEILLALTSDVQNRGPRATP
jgi:cytochrome c2